MQVLCRRTAAWIVTFQPEQHPKPCEGQCNILKDSQARSSGRADLQSFYTDRKWAISDSSTSFLEKSPSTLALLGGTWPPVAPHAATLWAQRQKSTRRHAGLAREREWQALLHRLHSGPWLAGPCPFLSNNLLLLARSLKFLNSWISNANIYLTIYLI